MARKATNFTHLSYIFFRTAPICETGVYAALNQSAAYWFNILPWICVKFVYKPVTALFDGKGKNMPRRIICLCGAILEQRAADLVLCCNRFCFVSCECALTVKWALLFHHQSKLHCNKCRKSWMLNHCKINVKNRHIVSTIIANKYSMLLFNTEMTLLYTNLCHWINNIIIMPKIKHQINTINNSLLSDV